MLNLVPENTSQCVEYLSGIQTFFQASTSVVPDERGFLGSGICSPIFKTFNTVIFCVLLIVLFLWWYPSHRTGSREGAFNQQER